VGREYEMVSLNFSKRPRQPHTKQFFEYLFEAGMGVRMFAEARFNELYTEGVLNLLLARSDSTLKWIL
jgi:hypothetical protein